MTPDRKKFNENVEAGLRDLQLRKEISLLNEVIDKLANENALLRDAINDALPWMIKLGDYIGNGTQADPMGRCNAITKMRIAVEKRDE